jgi:protein-disulfide isomerase
MRPKLLAIAAAVVCALSPSALDAQGKVAPLAQRSKGSPNAPVTVYEMSDFQCPYCRQFALQTFPLLEREFIRTGKVRWVFINYPLTSIHPHASAAAELATCAAQQNAFWRMHDLLFEHQQVWAPLKEAGPFFVSLADSARISKPTLVACLKSPETRSQVRADAEGAARSGATSTPSFYIEGGLLAGAAPVEVFREVLDSVHVAKTRKTEKHAPSADKGTGKAGT